LQERTDHERIAELFDRTEFWSAVAEDPFVRAEWVEAFLVAPTLKQDFYTVLSREDSSRKLTALLDQDPELAGCFV
jgi:glycerol-1-phosphate dehydrogenase [NAD(P)+]